MLPEAAHRNFAERVMEVLPVRSRFLLPAVSILGLAGLCYVLGAAVMYFKLPSEDFLRRSFVGAEAWFEQETAPVPKVGNDELPVLTQDVDKPEHTFDGFTLFTTDKGSQAFLINMRGEILHKWEVAYSKLWPVSPRKNPVSDQQVHFFGCSLFPNGDLLAVLQGQNDTPYGYGLIKVNKDSNVIWKYAENVHHDIDVTEDGTIYALTHETVSKLPKGLEFVPTPCLVDYLVLLSPDGVELKKISILDAFHNSPFALLLTAIDKTGKRSDLPPGMAKFGDVLHTNFVKVLDSQRASKFPMFKKGQVVISLRGLDVIAMLDLESAKIVWAARGPWRSQHDPQFLDNGNLLIFDNLGLDKRSRVLEFDPRTGAFPWSYSGESGATFFTPERGMAQRLPNGNTLICLSMWGRIMEVTPSKELVWQYSTKAHLPTARRYRPDEVTFLKRSKKNARP